MFLVDRIWSLMLAVKLVPTKKPGSFTLPSRAFRTSKGTGQLKLFIFHPRHSYVSSRQLPATFLICFSMVHPAQARRHALVVL